MIVRVYMKSNAIHEFPARDLSNAQEIAARATREGLWVIEDGDHVYYPITEVYKAKVVMSGASYDYAKDKANTERRN